MHGTSSQRDRNKPVLPIEIPDDSTALIKAVHKRNYEEVGRLVREDPGQLRGVTTCKIYGDSFRGVTALMIAAVLGYHEMIELLEKEVGCVDGEGRTALICAVVNFEDGSDGQRAYFSNEQMNTDCGDVCVTKLCEGRLKCIKLLAEMESRLKKNGSESSPHETALMKAAENGHTKIVEILLEKESGMQRSDGRTALMTAARYGHTDCVRLLVKKEGGVQDSYGWTALMRAAENGHTACIKLLLEKERGMQESDGWTALMIATRYGHTDCVGLLVEKEKDMKNNRGDTALDIAKRYNKNSIISLLS
ncbi:Ankyrin repeat protein [Giardia duodenalis]|uniref:Ankyrin repeat protein n=1 Tax=Giardia intestinalis TaxID=5741 RepID=V6TL06_GIAIN|nr:Ankyrin repeat protein [Giardia intestinalis]